MVFLWIILLVAVGILCILGEWLSHFENRFHCMLGEFLRWFVPVLAVAIITFIWIKGALIGF